MKNKVLFDHLSLKNGDVERKGDSKWARVTGVAIITFKAKTCEKCHVRTIIKAKILISQELEIFPNERSQSVPKRGSNP